jgi:hypothetical protein
MNAFPCLPIFGKCIQKFLQHRHIKQLNLIYLFRSSMSNLPTAMGKSQNYPDLIWTLVITLAALATSTAGQSIIDVLDFRPAAVQLNLANTSTQPYTAAQLNLLAKLGPKTQGCGRNRQNFCQYCIVF